tara:strand:- start:12592 stop:12903 length:312 start_codon:yes stop_codon:yes gene_type:complete
MSRLKDKLVKKFSVVEYVRHETSYGSTEAEKRTMNYEIEWNKDQSRGWYEIYDEESGGEDYYAEGILTFEGNELIDYDGVFELSEHTLNTLEEMGADVEEMRG